MAAPAFRSSASTGGASGNGITVTKPTGVVDNDILVAFLYIESDDAITPPSGWTQKVLAEQNGGGEAHRLYCYWKRAASDGANYSWNWASSAWNSGGIRAYSGCPVAGDPFDVTTSGVAGSASVTSPAVSLTTTVTDCKLIFSVASFSSSTWTSTPASFINSLLPSGGDQRSLDKDQTSAGSTGSLTATCDTSSWQTSILLALKSTTSTSGGGGGSTAPERRRRQRIFGTGPYL